MDDKQLKLVIQLFTKLLNEISATKALNQVLIERIGLKEGETEELLRQYMADKIKVTAEYDQKRFYDFLEEYLKEEGTNVHQLFPRN